jgi:antirestriction protein ArdC
MKLHELYAQVTSAIIKDLEVGVATWVKPDITPCPLGATSRRHSITSSARASSVGGTARPSALTVLRLMTSWSFVEKTI